MGDTRERRIAGVMGSGEEEHRELSAPLGAWLARAGLDLLTGGGPGVMAAVSRSFANVSGRRGLVIGVIPGETDATGYHAPPGYPNPWVELCIRTHLPLSGERGEEPMSRNHLNVLSPAVIVALPGGTGTASEVRLARRYRTPLIAFLGERGEIAGTDGIIASARREVRDAPPVARTLEEVAEFVGRVCERG